MSDSTLARLLRVGAVTVVVGLSVVVVRDVFAERLPLKSYTSADGLPHNEINKIVRDSRGFLWFCTSEGLSLFDGYGFRNYGTAEGLPHAVVTDILERRSGDYWVATFGGLVHFDPKGTPANAPHSPPHPTGPMFTVYSPDTGAPQARALTVLLAGRDGTIWVGTRAGLFRVAETSGHVALLPVEIKTATKWVGQSSVSALVEDRHGTLWVGSDSGLYRRWPDGSGVHHSLKDVLTFEHINDLLEDRHGNLWVGSRFDGLLKLTVFPDPRPPIVTRIYNRRNGLPTNWIFDVYESPDGHLWIGTNLGLADFSVEEDRGEGPLHVYTKRHGLIFHEISNVAEDRDGNLWLGTAEGAMKLARNGFVTFGEGDGILTAYPFFESDTGEIYFGGVVLGNEKRTVFEGATIDLSKPEAVKYWQTGIGSFNGERFNWVVPNATRGKGDITYSDRKYVLRTREGEWWLGRFLFSSLESFALLKTARAVEYTVESGLLSPGVRAVFEDSRGDVWISTEAQGGLALWLRTTRTVRDMSGMSPFKDRFVSAFEEDRAGNVWVSFEGAGGGLARYSAGRFQSFTADDGLPQSSISDLYLDREGRLWAATVRGGLVRVDDPTTERPAFTVYTTAKGLSSNNLNAVTEDLYGRIYVGTGRGVDRLVPATGKVEHFTAADGLVPGEIRAAFRERGGALWFSARNGFSRFVPEAERPSTPSPVVVTGLRIAGERQNVSALGETEIALPDLASDRNQLQIDFVGLSFAPGEVLQYQYQLEGADKDWSAPAEQRTVTYARLAPGSYRFLVRAVNSDGVVSTTPAALTFTVVPPIWQRWWFITLAAVVVALAVYALYRYRVARLIELEGVRTRIASDLHDDIGSGLSRIAVLSEVARHEAGASSVGERLSVIAGASRELVDSMSDIVWVINPERDQLLDLIQRMRRFASDVFTSRGVDFTFHAPSDEPNLKVSADVRRQLYLIYKECINNIVRHSGCTKAEIDLAVSGDILVLAVKDNGHGFDPSIAVEGNGLANMRERALMISGELEIHSDGAGTTVGLKVPLQATVKQHNGRLHRSRR